MPPRTAVPWDATVAEHLAAAPGALASASEQRPQEWIGRVIDERYRVVELLGEGGMGAVFVAEHLKLRKQVALKTIRPEFASNSQAEARFAREALATAQIDHPHVASAIDFGHLPEGGAYLVIALVRGVSLAAHLDTHGKIAWATAASLGAQIADGLAAAHAAGIVHRDLKPDNILLETRDDGRLHARVLDFGIAHVAEATAADASGASGSSSSQPLTRMGAILGTPGYMPPEQAVGEAVDARGDLYALGVILWECCTGRRLWQGESVIELVTCQLGSTAPTLHQELGSQVPEAFSELIAQLLAATPGKRPEAAGPVRDALRRLSLKETAPPDGPLRRIDRGSLRAAVPAVLAPPRSRRTKLLDGLDELRARRGVVPAIAGGLAVLLTCGLLWTDDGDDRVLADEVASNPDEAQHEPDAAPSASAKPAARADAARPPEAPPVIPPPVGDEPPLPPALAQPLVTLLNGDEKRARKRAAEAVLEHKPKEAVPVYALNLAWLEKASSCGNKRGVIEKMETAADPRVLPALRRLSSTRRKGCGFFGSQDCLDCLREPLARTIGRLEAVASAAAIIAP